MAAAEPEPSDAFAAFFRDSSPSVIIEIVRRLPARSLLRLRSVCKELRKVTSYRVLLATLHLLHPPQPLLCFGHDACPHRYVQLRDYCVEALDLRSGVLRPALRFTDNEYFDFIENAEAVDAPPIIAFSKDHVRYGADEETDDTGHPRLVVHASVDGLLLASFVNIWYVCNPATREWAALPDFLADCDVIGMYAHASSGELRVLYHTGRDDEGASTCYYVLKVGAQEARSIGCPVSPAATTVKNVGLDTGLDPASLSPPVQVGRNLHWPPQERQGYHILVFDTEAEVFHWMRSPIGSENVFFRSGIMQLLEMDHKLAMSVSRRNKPTLQLWRLEDYRNEIWNQVYRITIQVPRIPALRSEDWFPRVVSAQGDVLIECSNNKLLHCDRYGNLLQKYHFREETPLVRHALKETLLPHPIFVAPKAEDVVEVPFFQGL